MNWQEFTALLLLVTAMSFSPGPNTTLSTALAANHGLRHTLPFICAVPVGWGVLLSLCALGLGALLLAVPWLTWTIKLIGITYLLWLAVKLIGVRFRLFGRGARSAESGATPERPSVGFWQGVALQFISIKAWLLALAVISGWVAGRGDAGMRFAIVLSVTLAYALASNLTYALIGSLLKNWLAGPNKTGRRLVWFNRAMAGVLVATAAWMVTV